MVIPSPTTLLSTNLALALRNLGRNRIRSAVAIFTVASGVIAFLLAGGFIAWIFQDMREATIHSQLGHAQIVRPGFFNVGIANPYAFLLPGAGKELKALRSLPGVESISPRLLLSGLISLGETTLPFAGEGIDPLLEKPISARIKLLDNKDLASSNEKKVLLGEGLANSLGAKPGDSVVLLSKTVSGSPNAVELTVAGRFATISKDYDDYAIRLPISIAHKLLRVDGATSWVVLLDSVERTEPFVSAARRQLQHSEFEIVPWTELADFYNKTVSLFSKQVTVMKIIIGLIIVLTISNTMTMNVLERTTEIGTSLAVGIRNSHLMWQFIIEGALIGILGGMIGVLLGYLLAMIISAIGIPMPPPPGMAHGYIGRIIVTPDLAFDGVALALLTTLIASALPAWKASRMNIIDALRYSQ
jgi:putative ABC transport system permease protein